MRLRKKKVTAFEYVLELAEEELTLLQDAARFAYYSAGNPFNNEERGFLLSFLYVSKTAGDDKDTKF